jgi:hypothetical protein
MAAEAIRRRLSVPSPDELSAGMLNLPEQMVNTVQCTPFKADVVSRVPPAGRAVT